MLMYPKLQQARFYASQQYDRHMMLMNATAFAHLTSFRELLDNTTTLWINNTATAISPQMQQFNQIIINDMLKQYNVTIQQFNS